MDAAKITIKFLFQKDLTKKEPKMSTKRHFRSNYLKRYILFVVSFVEILTGDFNLLRYSVASLDGNGDIARAGDEFIDEVQVVGGVEIDGAVGGGVLVAMTIEIDVECDSILCNRCGIIDEIDGGLDVDTID